MAKKAAAKKPAAKKPAGRTGGKPQAANRLTADVRVGLLAGKDHFMRTEHTAALRAALREAHGDIDEFRFDGARAEPAEVLDECRSFGLMSGHKLVVVDEAEEFVREDTRPMLERYTESPADGATLLLRAERKLTGNLPKAIGAAGGYVECDPPGEDQAVRWAIKRAGKQHGAGLDPAAARALVDRLGPDLGRIDAELGKLAVAAGAGGTITTEHLAELGAGTRAFEPWAVQEGMATGDPERALARVREILDEAPKDLTYPAMLAAVQLAQKLHGAAEGLAAGERPDAVARANKLWGPARDPVLAAARRTGPDAARRLFLLVLDAQGRTMSGLGTTRRALELAALRIASRL